MLFIMAWRNIWRNKARSLIIMFSVAIGLFAGLFVLAIYKGMMNSRINTVIQDEVAHLQVHHPLFKNDFEAADTISGGNRILQQLRQLPDVKQVAARSLAQGMLATATGSNGVEIRGVLPESEKAVSRLDKKIVNGTYFGGQKKNELLIGKKLFDKMNLRLNNKVVLTFTDKDNNVIAAAFRISGVYKSTNTPLDERIVYVKMEDLNPLLNINHSFHELAVLLQKDEELDAAKQQVQTKYPGLLVETWKEVSPETEMSVATVNQFSLIIIAIIMLALAFGIINTMLMAILERTRETGMMLALGMNKPRLFFMILMETLFLTLLGVPVGLMLAWAITGYTGHNGINTASFAKEAMEDFGYSSIIYPQYPQEQLANVLLMVVITALASSVFPALKALRLQPVEALRK